MFFYSNYFLYVCIRFFTRGEYRMNTALYIVLSSLLCYSINVGAVLVEAVETVEPQKQAQAVPTKQVKDLPPDDTPEVLKQEKGLSQGEVTSE
jgi:hypothetical protein